AAGTRARTARAATPARKLATWGAASAQALMAAPAVENSTAAARRSGRLGARAVTRPRRRRSAAGGRRPLRHQHDLRVAPPREIAAERDLKGLRGDAVDLLPPLAQQERVAAQDAHPAQRAPPVAVLGLRDLQLAALDLLLVAQVGRDGRAGLEAGPRRAHGGG